MKAPRLYLTQAEIETLLGAVRSNRNGERDAAMILIAFRHGLRAIELVGLCWDQVEFNAALLHVRRAKNGSASVHPLAGDELRILRKLHRDKPDGQRFVFVSERGVPFTTGGFAVMLGRAGAAAEMPFKPHPHMLRHACGFALANKGVDTRSLQAYLGHKNIQHTVRYTELDANRFRNFWS